jgi:hypothetical protein
MAGNTFVLLFLRAKEKILKVFKSFFASNLLPIPFPVISLQKSSGFIYFAMQPS